MFNDPSGAEGIQPGPPGDLIAMTMAAWIANSRPGGPTSVDVFAAQSAAEMQAIKSRNESAGMGFTSTEQVRAYVGLLLQGAQGHGQYIYEANGTFYGGTYDTDGDRMTSMSVSEVKQANNGGWFAVSETSIIEFSADQGYQETDLHSYSQWGRKIAGWTLAASIPLQQAYERASLYPGKPAPWATTLVKYEKTILGKKIVQPLFTMNSVKAGKWATGLKVVSKTVGAIGGGLAVYDMSQNGITTSNALDLAMSGMALTGFGTSIAGAYFILNARSMLFTGKDIGQHIDAASTSLTGKSITQYINGK